LPIIDGDVTQAIEVDKVSGQLTSDLVVNTTVKDALTAAGISDVKLAHLNNSLTRSVGGVFKDNPILGQGYISLAVAREIAPGEDLPVNSVFLTLDEGANVSAVRAEVEAVTKPYMTINVQDKEEYKGESVKTVSTMLSVLYGLLGLSVIIAVLGIINTLALSVIERRQEIGMLRAVGMLRSQIRRMIYIESANIAVFGALVGAAIGLGVGWCFVTTLSGQGLDSIIVPWANMAWMIVASGVIGVLAAVIPGTRAARTKPLEAITD
jgi:ABC lipoprotein transporter, permease component